MAVSSDVKLYCYNEALRILESRKITSLTENRESRRVLDSAWGAGDEGVIYCLEMAGWNFAMRATKLEYDPSLEASFGFAYAYAIPDDMVRLESLSGGEYFSLPLTAREYSNEAGYWWSDISPLYVKFVSKGDDFGLNSGNWPVSFKKYLAAYLAKSSCKRITGSDNALKAAIHEMRESMKHAKSLDAQAEGTKFPTTGSWVRARLGGQSRRDRTYWP